LVIALFSNLFVLPSLLLTLDQRAITKAFKEPMIEVFDEEEDMELDKLVIEEMKTKEPKPDKYKKI